MCICCNAFMLWLCWCKLTAKCILILPTLFTLSRHDLIQKHAQIMNLHHSTHWHSRHHLRSSSWASLDTEFWVYQAFLKCFLSRNLRSVDAVSKKSLLSWSGLMKKDLCFDESVFNASSKLNFPRFKVLMSDEWIDLQSRFQNWAWREYWWSFLRFLLE